MGAVMVLDPVAWIELTTEKGAAASRFYSQVLGVEAAEFEMGDYSDYSLPAGEPGFGICHPASSDGVNPPGWIVYLQVPDLVAALARAKRLGGTILKGPHAIEGYGTYGVIRDPAGATTAFFELEAEDTGRERVRRR